MIFLYQHIFIAMETFIVSFTYKTFITLLFNMNSIYQGLYDVINSNNYYYKSRKNLIFLKEGKTVICRYSTSGKSGNSLDVG